MAVNFSNKALSKVLFGLGLFFIISSAISLNILGGPPIELLLVLLVLALLAIIMGIIYSKKSEITNGR
ncbi:hypothetical protein KJ765_03960 [Candidatus Micrarchaeota archaeon]|nr:hypothetical protein [Candidatus Micrarchaeota archaeon]